MTRWLVIAALSAAPSIGAPHAQEAPLQSEVDAAVARGVAYLRKAQLPGGAFPYQGNLRMGATALSVYALLKSGVPADDSAVVRAVERLNDASAEHTYDVACLLMALAARDAEEHREWIAELAELLLSWQNAQGDWGYPGGSDLSNTQYAALGLRAAVAGGAELPSEAWQELASATMGYRASGGGFSYGGSGGASASMTAAGVGTLTICERFLSRAGALDTGDVAAIDRRREGGLDWLARNYESALSEPSGWQAYYRLYGIERVGSLLGLAKLGGRDWYGDGAKILLELQNADGSWAATNEGQVVVETSFALLFLRRATRASLTGFRPGSGPSVFGVEGDEAAVSVRATGADPLTIWITGWGTAAMTALEWPRQGGRGPHVERVEYLVEGRVVQSVEGDPSEPADVERFPVQHRFRGPGTYRLRCRVHAVGPPDQGLRPSILESPEFLVTVENILPEWQRAQREDRRLNRVHTDRVRAKASSSRPDRPGSYAVDGRRRTSWLADPKDEKPRLTLVFSPAVEADSVLVGNALAVPFRSGLYRRALEVELTINGRERHRVTMAPDERRKSRLRLADPVKVRQLELEVLWSVEGDRPQVGFSEVELQLGEERGSR